MPLAPGKGKKMNFHYGLWKETHLPVLGFSPVRPVLDFRWPIHVAETTLLISCSNNGEVPHPPFRFFPTLSTSNQVSCTHLGNVSCPESQFPQRWGSGLLSLLKDSRSLDSKKQERISEYLLRKLEKQIRKKLPESWELRHAQVLLVIRQANVVNK